MMSPAVRWHDVPPDTQQSKISQSAACALYSPFPVSSLTNLDLTLNQHSVQTSYMYMTQISVVFFYYFHSSTWHMPFQVLGWTHSHYSGHACHGIMDTWKNCCRRRKLCSVMWSFVFLGESKPQLHAWFTHIVMHLSLHACYAYCVLI